MATLAIFVRSVFRCVELREGFRGKLANQQFIFMVLEGRMIVIAVGSLTLWHPGLMFQGIWQEMDGVPMSMGKDKDSGYERSRQVGHIAYQLRNGFSVRRSVAGRSGFVAIGIYLLNQTPATQWASKFITLFGGTGI